MESQRQIEKQYNKLIKDVETDDFYKADLTNRVNCYVCQKCGHITKTKDVDPGVTPFIIGCERCGGESHSTFYKDIRPDNLPTQEWYRPSLKEVLKMRNKPYSNLEHVLRGGLVMRRIVQTA